MKTGQLFSKIKTNTSLLDGVQGLNITKMVVPQVADLRRPMKLECLFDMEGEELYAVKWYKDYQEFFRYRPHGEPQAETMSFPVAGVHLDPDEADCGNDHCTLVVRHLSREQSGGAYRCEVSTEAPTFRLDSRTVNVTVAALPEEQLRIEGLANSYADGDYIEVKCVAAPSDPVPILTWYINGIQANPTYIDDTNPSTYTRRTSSLRYPLRGSREEVVTLKCVAALPGVPLPPQEAVVKARIKGVQPEVGSNQQLHWYKASAAVVARSWLVLMGLVVLGKVVERSVVGWLRVG